VDKGTIEVEHILAVDQHGRPIDADRLKPSAETPLHLLLYRTMGAGAVLHTHSLPAALLSQLARDEGRILLSGWELLKGLSGIDTHEVEISLPVFPNSQDMQALSTRVERSLSRERSCYGFCWQDTASMRGARISPRPNDISRSSNIFSNANER
jgi:methylthioribulose-1-phosphate dehydratase